jgi:hypothetical protein
MLKNKSIVYPYSYNYFEEDIYKNMIITGANIDLLIKMYDKITITH